MKKISSTVFRKEKKTLGKVLLIFALILLLLPNSACQ